LGFDEQPMMQTNSEEVDFIAASESFRPLRNFKRNDPVFEEIATPFRVTISLIVKHVPTLDTVDNQIYYTIA
jgi:hypothetical protein